MSLLKKVLGIKEKNVKKDSELEIGILENKIIIKFKEPTRYVEFDRLQALDLLTALTKKITLIKK